MPSKIWSISVELKRSVPLNSRCSRKCETPASDRKSTRLNSSHTIISYAVFYFKKNKNVEDVCFRNVRLLQKDGLDHYGGGPVTIAWRAFDRQQHFFFF